MTQEIEEGTILPVTAVVAKLQRRPALGKAFYQLSAGDIPGKVGDMDKLYIPYIHCILSANVFGEASESEDASYHWERQKESQRLIHESRSRSWGRRLAKEVIDEPFLLSQLHLDPDWRAYVCSKHPQNHSR
jgi:hypothetical protein